MIIFYLNLQDIVENEISQWINSDRTTLSSNTVREIKRYFDLTKSLICLTVSLLRNVSSFDRILNMIFYSSNIDIHMLGIHYRVANRQSSNGTDRNDYAAQRHYNGETHRPWIEIDCLKYDLVELFFLYKLWIGNTNIDEGQRERGAINCAHPIK